MDEAPSQPPVPLPTARGQDVAFVGPLEAALRHPGLTALPLLLLVGAAIALGLTRTPVYTAEARINVGRVDVPAYALQGVTSGNQLLAANFARAAEAMAVVVPAARLAGISATQAADRLSASPVPGSTLIRVEAEGSSRLAAARLANAGSQALVRYVQVLNLQQEPTGLLEQYRNARRAASSARRRLLALTASGSTDVKLVESARLDLVTASLKAQTLDGQYRALGGLSSQNVLQLISPAVRADSDRSTVLQQLVLVGFAGGLTLGLGLALLASNSRLRRKRPV